MKPKLISLGVSLPFLFFTQHEVFAELGYPSKFWRVFQESSIVQRHFSVPLDKVRQLSFQEQQETYLRTAQLLSCGAINNCLDGRDAKEIGLLVYGSCTGLAPGPTVAHYLAKDFALSPSTYYNNIIGQGCESGFPGLKRAFDFVTASNRPALVVNCELASLTYYPEPGDRPDPENHYELLRANSIFGDAAAAALVGYDDDPRHPAILDMETYTDVEYIGDLGYTWRNGRLRVMLSRRVPELAAKVVAPAVAAVLERQHMEVQDIEWWVIHAAGNTVLDNIRDALHLPEEKLALSRETLKLYGNTSSTSVYLTGKRLMSQDIKAGDYCAILSVGPGMSGGMTLLRFGV